MGITNHTELQVSTFRNGLHEKCGDEGMNILNFGIIKWYMQKTQTEAKREGIFELIHIQVWMTQVLFNEMIPVLY